MDINKDIKFNEKMFQETGVGILEQNMTRDEFLIASYAKHKEARIIFFWQMIFAQTMNFMFIVFFVLYFFGSF